MQARKRALRPTQTRPCNVTWLGYHNTMLAQALDIIGSKATAATLLNGDDLSSGLMQIDLGMSLLQELARRVLRDEESVNVAAEIANQFAAAGNSLLAAMQVGSADLVGVTPDAMVGPDVTLRLVPTPLVPPLPAAQTPTPHDGDGELLSWAEVIVRNRRRARQQSQTDDPHRVIQYAFLMD